MIKSVTQSCPSWIPGKTSRKYKFPYPNFQLSEIYKIYLQIYVFVDKNAMQLVKIPLRVTKDVKIQDGRHHD